MSPPLVEILQELTGAALSSYPGVLPGSTAATYQAVLTPSPNPPEAGERGREGMGARLTTAPAPAHGGMASGRGADGACPVRVAGRLYPDTGISTGLSGEKVDGATFTGKGEKTDIWCGEIRTNAVCSAHADQHSFRAVAARTCRDLTCPECWPMRAAELGESVSQRVWALHLIKRAYKPRHVSFSMPSTEYHKLARLSPEDREKAVRSWGQKMAKEAGLTAGAIVVHLFRIRKEYQQWCNDEASRINAEHSSQRQQFRRENRYTVIPRDDWKNFVVFAPHVHVVGYGFLMDAATFHERTGIVYRIHNGGKQMRHRDDVSRAVFYLLSHVSPVGGRQVVTYFGTISYNKLVCIEENEREEIERCPDCGAPRVYADTGEYVVKRVVDRVFLLKDTGERSQTTSIRGQDSIFLYLGPDSTMLQ